MKKALLWSAIAVLAISASFELVWGVSQWSRKYDVECQTCHTGFPRLNDFGEEFMRNGYQMPGTMDGDETGKKQVGNGLFIDDLDNVFGLRVSLTPVAMSTHGRTLDGEQKTKVDIGHADWLQLFTAGSPFKNTSIFIETEINTATSKAKNSWFRLGFHNLFGPQGFANIRVGQLSPMEWHAISGRLRMIPNVKIQSISNVVSSNGAGEESVPLASSQPGIDFYGYSGPVLYSVGIVNPAKGADPNQFKNYFGSLRLEQGSGPFEGSSVSLWAMQGTDTKDSKTAQIQNGFWRISPALNIRSGPVDLIGGFFYGEDDNWTLLSQSPVENIFRGTIVQLGYTFSEQVYGVLQYDLVDSDLAKSIEYQKLTPSIWFFPRSNMRIGATIRIDLMDTDPVLHPDKIHEAIVTIRAML